MKQVTMIECGEWDTLVKETYSRPYCFQQQDNCKGRGTHKLIVPFHEEDYENDSVPEIINHSEIGVSFKAWLNRDPKQALSCDPDGKTSWGISLWWHRNFYPNVQMVANDLHAKGLLPAGNYVINIDW